MTAIKVTVPEVAVPKMELQPYQNVSEFWGDPQTEMGKVLRWNNYAHDPAGQVRHQTVLEHTAGIVNLAIVLGFRARTLDKKFDMELFLMAAQLHDQGEAIIHAQHGKDILFKDKCEADDYNEYTAFMRRIGLLPDDLQASLERAFLLQFALNNPTCFTPRARTVMNTLFEARHVECVTFRALEIWDYLLYAMEQYRRFNNVKILVQVLRGQADRMDSLAARWNGIAKLIWTNNARGWCRAFMAAHEGQFLDIPPVPK